jgi:type IV pilus assembly protein PilM
MVLVLSGSARVGGWHRDCAHAIVPVRPNGAGEEEKDTSVFARSKAVAGLDIGSSAAKVAELRPSGRSYKVVGFGLEPVPADAIVDGAIIDATAVAGALDRLFTASRIRTREVAASLSGSSVIVKKIALPVMTEEELAESIQWEAEQYVPFDIADVNLDYQILSTPADASKGNMEVLLVAAKKDKIADYTDVIRQAGRTPVVVDVDAFAVQNVYEANYDIEPGGVVALLNAGASSVNVNIVSGGQSLFTRDISMGGNGFTEAVQKELGLPFEQAERVKRGEPVEGVQPADVVPILRAVTENLLLEIQKTLDFFRATSSSDRVDRVLVSGGASRVDGFAERLSERFGTPVESLDPFRRIEFDAGRFGFGGRDEVAAVSAVAVGLALRRTGDR